LNLYKVGTDIYEIPEEKNNEFVLHQTSHKRNPVPLQSFRVDGEIYDIPISKVEKFEKYWDERGIDIENYENLSRDEKVQIAAPRFLDSVSDTIKASFKALGGKLSEQAQQPAGGFPYAQTEEPQGSTQLAPEQGNRGAVWLQKLQEAASAVERAPLTPEPVQDAVKPLTPISEPQPQQIPQPPINEGISPLTGFKSGARELGLSGLTYLTNLQASLSADKDMHDVKQEAAKRGVDAQVVANERNKIMEERATVISKNLETMKADRPPEELVNSQRSQELLLDAVKNPSKYIKDQKGEVATAFANNITESLPMTLSSVIPFAGQAAMVATEGGRWQDEAKTLGITDPKILRDYGTAFGLPSSVIEVYMNKILLAPLGGKNNPATKGIIKMLNKHTSKIAIKIAAPIMNVIFGAAGEGGEEVAQGTLSDYVMSRALRAQAEKHIENGQPEKAQELINFATAKVSEATDIKKRKPEFILGSLAGLGLGAGSQIAADVLNLLKGTDQKAEKPDTPLPPLPPPPVPSAAQIDDTSIKTIAPEPGKVYEDPAGPQLTEFIDEEDLPATREPIEPSPPVEEGTAVAPESVVQPEEKPPEPVKPPKPPTQKLPANMKRAELISELEKADPELKAKGLAKSVLIDRVKAVRKAPPTPTPVVSEKPTVETVKADEVTQKEIVTEPVEKIIAPAKDKLASSVEVEEARKEPGLVDNEKPDKAFKNKRLDAARELAKLPEIPQAERKAFETSAANAVGSGMVDTAEDIAGQINADETRLATDEESIAMEIRLEEVEESRDQVFDKQTKLVEDGNIIEAAALNDKINDLNDKVERLTRAGRQTGTRVGRALAIRRFQKQKAALKAKNVSREASLAKGEKLTVEESAKFKEMSDQLKSLEKQVKEFQDAAQKDIDKSRQDEAAKNLKTEMRSIKRRRSKESTAKERKSIKEELKKLGVNVNLGLNPEYAVLLGRLAKTYIEDGVTDLQELSDKMIKDVPDLQKRDVMEVIANRSTGQLKKAEGDAVKILRELRTQARLILEIEEALDGILKEPKKGKRKTRSPEVKKLQKKLDELRHSVIKTTREDARLRNILKKLERVDQQIEGQFRDIKKNKPNDPQRIEDAKKALNEARSFMRTTDNMANVKNQLLTKNFDVAPARQAAITSERLDRARVELRQLRKKAKVEIDKLKPRTGLEKTFDVVADVGGIPRTLMTMGEMSGLLRQGMLLICHLSFSGKKGLSSIGQSIGGALKATFSANTAEAIQVAIESDPRHFERIKDGLELTDADMGVLNKEEDFVVDNLVDKIPVLGAIKRASERNMITLLNLLRISAYDTVIDSNPGMSTDQRKQWARTVNAMSGRSSLKKFLTPRSMKAVSILGFAPNFAASRIEALIRVPKNLADPVLRKESVKTVAGFLTFQTVFYALASLAGGEIGDDPEEFDYGRVTFGNSKVDFLAGLNQPFRVLLISTLFAMDKLGLRKATKNLRPMSALGSFLRYKQSPLVGLPPQMIFGEDIFGRPISRVEIAVRNATALFAQEIYDAADLNVGSMKKKAAAWVAGAAIFGGSAVSIENALLRPKVRKIYKKTGIGRIDPPEWPDWTKDRKYIKQKERLDAAFHEQMAVWILANEKRIKGKSKKSGKKTIQTKATNLRKTMKIAVPKSAPRK